ncbi:MAG: CehA/McbA family metallohydrolase [Planctomycetaceae bacterium]|nr:CehA/McbA family metallohydrolase [Planctomycetaceae bacterium]
MKVVHATEFRGTVVDHQTGAPIAARIYLQNKDGEWLFVNAGSPGASALPYTEQWVPIPGSVELHTTVSAHEFVADLDPGEYTITIEKGKEYLPVTETIKVSDSSQVRQFPLHRISHPAAQGWYCGETHVHRRIQELPIVMAAEDLNVAFPVTYWTVRSDRVPDLQPSTLRRQGPSPFGPREDRGSEPVWIDRRHVILPRNTEYEIFSVGEQRHVLGAVFLLNHQTVMTQTAPPIAPIAERAHQEGALLDLDKHSWPWAAMLVPVAQVDLFELSNNSVWRTQFGFRQTQVSPADWMNVESDGPGTLTEWGWLNFGFEFYYALLNCGFQIMPTAGTASGVHPVPLGYSRVYVHVDSEQLDVDEWTDGLRHGRSFVTTGPLLYAKLDQQHAGHRFQLTADTVRDLEFSIETDADSPVTQIEILQNGRVVHRVAPQPTAMDTPGFHSSQKITVRPDRSSWYAVRVIQSLPGGRRRFAHSAPWFVSIDDQPLKPRREQVQYFIDLLNTEITRNEPVLSEDAMTEFRQALSVYESILQRAE